MRHLSLFVFFIAGLTTLDAQESDVPFRKQVLDDKISIGYGLAIGDVDGDNKPDIILADKKQIAWYRNGDWKKSVIAENLTESDNVCVAVADPDADGKVEIAVGAQWNPGETTDDTKSGAVFYLKRPADITSPWQPVRLHHEPTVHRMKWIKAADGKFYLVVAPLHGRGNKQGQGVGAKLLAYSFSPDLEGNWPLTIIDSSSHLTHNFALERNSQDVSTTIYLASKEGLKALTPGPASGNGAGSGKALNVTNYPSGEVSIGNLRGAGKFLATIEPMHGNSVVIYEAKNSGRTVLDTTLNEGHAIATADLLNAGSDQVVAGWRLPDREGKTGIRMYVRAKENTTWTKRWIDEGGIAVEDLQVADLNGDGAPEIIASGRATRNVIIYWNESRLRKK